MQKHLFLIIIICLSPNIKGKEVFTPKEILIESLRFKLYWSFLPVGFAQLDTHFIEKKQYLRHRFSIRTNSVVRYLYKVNTTIISHTKPSFNKSLYYSKDQDEGGKKQKQYILFDWENNKTTLYKDNKVTHTQTLDSQDYYDPLSMLFGFRQKFKKGLPINLNVTDGKSLKTVILDKYKKTKVSIGDFRQADLLQPSLDGLRGVFKKSKNATLDLYFSQDDYKFLLMLKSKVRVGKFKAELISQKAFWYKLSNQKRHHK